MKSKKKTKNDYSGPLIFNYKSQHGGLFNRVLLQAVQKAFCFFISKQTML